MDHDHRDRSVSRRRFLAGAGALGAGALGVAAFGGSSSARAADPNAVDLPFVNGSRPLTSDFPERSNMILQRTRPPLLETPFEVFDQGVLTPPDRFYVRWHLANIPTSIDPATFRLVIHGHVNKTVSLTLDEIATKFERFEIVAVNQCSGNGRGFFSPRVPGGEGANGAMGGGPACASRIFSTMRAFGRRPRRCVSRASNRVRCQRRRTSRNPLPST